MSNRARALVTCRDCSKEDYVNGEVGGGRPYADPPEDAEFYPDIEGTIFAACGICRWPQLDIDDVVPIPRDRR